ncbi:hypothetical protein Nepgr_016341 [Nepenthes gracilis]|uniref:Uncharacterized protein n=1 Tax=Nepenthes gracilis TaxID=150966 RepID=A0AAD3SPL4_NEPGR|nr:hypothetical protein Nepgr_016341 [Nepenthes gracilis]
MHLHSTGNFNFCISTGQLGRHGNWIRCFSVKAVRPHRWQLATSTKYSSNNIDNQQNRVGKRLQTNGIRQGISEASSTTKQKKP